MAPATEVASEAPAAGLDEGGMPTPHWPLQKHIHDAVTSGIVEAFLVALIFVSFICVTVETDREAVGMEPLFGVSLLSGIILALYTIELACKVYVFRLQYFLNVWNWLDVFVVLSDYITIILETVLASTISLKFLRILRLARLARSARALRYFPQMALMVQGLFATLRIMASGLVLLVAFLAIVGVLAVQLLHPVNLRVAQKGLYDGCDRCPRAFESTFNAAMTFSQQIVTGDSWGQVSLPIIEEAPESLLFIGLVFITLNLMVMNVILSMVVDSSLKASEEDTQRQLREKEKAAKEYADQLKNMCQELDQDDSGMLTKSELLEGFERNPQFREMMSLMDFTLEDVDAVFGSLDKDGSGDVNYDEFVQELYKMKSNQSQRLLVFIKVYLSEIKDLMTNMVQMEFDQIHRAVGVAEPPPAQKPGSRESKAQQAPKRDSVHDILLEIRQGLREDVARMVQELGRKTDSQRDLLLQMQGGAAPTRLSAEDLAPARARPVPQCVPQPALEEAGRSLQVLTLPAPAAHQLGPCCHYARSSASSRGAAGAFLKGPGSVVRLPQ